MYFRVLLSKAGFAATPFQKRLFERVMEIAEPKVTSALEDVGRNTLMAGADFIERNVHRTPTSHKLSKALMRSPVKVYKRYGDMNLSIIDERYMNSKANYWYVANYGKTEGGTKFIPPKGARGGKVYGKFADGSKPNKNIKAGTSRFIVTGNKKDYLLKPNRAVRPIHYIEYMKSYARRELSKIVSAISKGKKK